MQTDEIDSIELNPNNSSINVALVRKIKYYFFNLHDKTVNQKYGNGLPYSYHLASAANQLIKIQQLHKIELTKNPNCIEITYLDTQELFALLLIATYAHDSIEDGNITYNDLVKILTGLGLHKYYAVKVADIVYCVTDEKGKSREERKSDKFYEELIQNEEAIIVKFADLLANLLYSITNNHSSVKNKYKEFEHFCEKLGPDYRNKYYFIINYMTRIFHLLPEFDE